MILEELPVEVLIAIVGFLFPWDVVSLAQTWKHSIFHVCSPVLRSRWQTRRDISAMKICFPDGGPWRQAFYSGCGLDKLYDKLGLSSIYGDFQIPTPNKYAFPKLEYLLLDGRFDWLQRLPVSKRAQDAEIKEWHDEITALQHQAEQVGLTLPSSFVRFWTSRDLQQRMYLVQKVKGAIDPKLRRVYSTSTKMMTGYLIRFMDGSDESRHLGLYLDTGPERWHCVISIATELRYFRAGRDLRHQGSRHNSTDYETRVMYELNTDREKLYGPGFEEYMAAHFFGTFSEHMARYVREGCVPLETIHNHYLWSSDEVLDALRLFMVNNFCGIKAPVAKLDIIDSVAQSTSEVI